MASHWADTQAAFAASLLDPELPVPPGVLECAGADARNGFDVYRNNVAASLIDALQARFAVTAQLVGETFFRAMARRFIASCPPRSPLLMQYGDELPAFIAGFEPASTVPYLCDVARFEIAWSEAYHAADATALAADAISPMAPEDLLRTRLSLHPTTRILRSTYPIATLWSAHWSAHWAAHQASHPHNDRADAHAALACSPGEDVLLVRPQAEVHVHRLPAGGYAFIAALLSGADLQDAAEAGLCEFEAFDAGRHTVALFDAGAVIALVAHRSS